MKIIFNKNNREVMITSFVAKDGAESDRRLRSATFYKTDVFHYKL